MANQPVRCATNQINCSCISTFCYTIYLFLKDVPLLQHARFNFGTLISSIHMCFWIGLLQRRKKKCYFLFSSFYFLPFEFHVPLMPDSCHIVELLKYHYDFSSPRFVGASLIIHSIFLSYFNILSYLYIIADCISVSVSLSSVLYSTENMLCIYISIFHPKWCLILNF